VLASAIKYAPDYEEAVERIASLLKADYIISRRALALLLLQGDEEIHSLVAAAEGNDAAQRIDEIVREAASLTRRPVSYVLGVTRQRMARSLARRVMWQARARPRNFAETLSWLLTNPWTGIPIAYLGLRYLFYPFVAVFGAGVAVNFLEGKVFGHYINPWAIKLVNAVIPFQVFRDLLVGEYGVITLGVRYAVALILPIVATFFLAFSVLEDTGYFPRLALLIDRAFKLIGLNGRAVIPMVLGFGCDTMATIVTRILETKRERLLATFLLALAIPCSAQLGVIMSLLGKSAAGFWIWVGVVSGVFLLVGFIASRILPGEPARFYMDVPPLRLPRLSNILKKSYARVKWYFFEVLPVFILASVIIWLGKMTRLFDLAVLLMSHPVQWIGLPPQASVAFLFGFFRRDYGAAGLFDLQRRGLLTPRDCVVAAIVLTLFIPCVAQFAVTARERGWKTAVAMTAFILPFSFAVGGVVSFALAALGVKL
jgi:ferrous iron transport protein B